MTQPTLARGLGGAGLSLLLAFVLFFALPLTRMPLLAARFVAVLVMALALRSVYPRLLGVSAADVGASVSGRTFVRAAVGVGLGAATLLLAFCIAWGAGAFTVAPGVDARSHTEVILELGLFVIGAVLEELVFRCGLVGSLRLVLPPGLAIGASAAVFGLLHAMNPDATVVAVTNTTLAGVLIGLLFIERNGAPRVPSLGLCTGFHFAWNAVQGQLLGIPVSGYVGHSRVLSIEARDVAWSGGSYGLEGGYGASLALVLLCVWAARKADLRTSSWAASPR